MVHMALSDLYQSMALRDFIAWNGWYRLNLLGSGDSYGRLKKSEKIFICKFFSNHMQKKTCEPNLCPSSVGTEGVSSFLSAISNQKWTLSTVQYFDGSDDSITQAL